MKEGNLVKFMGAHDLKQRIGIIIKVMLPRNEGPLGMDVYEVMKEDGTIETKPVSSDGWFLGKYPEKEAELADLAGFFGFKDGVEDALEALKKEFTHTKYASGKTLGEVAAERVEERLRKEKKYGIPPPERGDGWGEKR